MIVRILGEGQWQVSENGVRDLNELDAAVEQAVASNDEASFEGALHRLLDEVRTLGVPVPDAELADSDLILPGSDSTIDDVRALLTESDEGLIPN